MMVVAALPASALPTAPTTATQATHEDSCTTSNSSSRSMASEGNTMMATATGGIGVSNGVTEKTANSNSHEKAAEAEEDVPPSRRSTASASTNASRSKSKSKKRSEGGKSKESKTAASISQRRKGQEASEAATDRGTASSLAQLKSGKRGKSKRRGSTGSISVLSSTNDNINATNKGSSNGSTCSAGDKAPLNSQEDKNGQSELVSTTNDKTSNTRRESNGSRDTKRANRRRTRSVEAPKSRRRSASPKKSLQATVQAADVKSVQQVPFSQDSSAEDKVKQAADAERPAEQDAAIKDENAETNQESQPSKDVKRANRRRTNSMEAAAPRRRSMSPKRSLSLQAPEQTAQTEDLEENAGKDDTTVTVTTVDEHQQKKRSSTGTTTTPSSSGRPSMSKDASRRKTLAKTDRKRQPSKRALADGAKDSDAKGSASLGGIMTSSSDPALDSSQPSRISNSGKDLLKDSSAVHSINSDTTGTTATTHTTANSKNHHLLTQASDSAKRERHEGVDRSSKSNSSSNRRSGSTRGLKSAANAATTQKSSSTSSSRKSNKESRRSKDVAKQDDDDDKPDTDLATAEETAEHKADHGRPPEEPTTNMDNDQDDQSKENQKQREEQPISDKEKPEGATTPAEEKEKGDSQSTDFGHLPDFQVSDFSFRDLAFGFDDKNGFAEWDDGDAGGDEDAPGETDQIADETRSINSNNTNPAESQAEDATPQEGSSGVWVCQNCQEEHDESELQFCGMCGQDRPKTTPKNKRAIRRPTGKRGVRRDGEATGVRRQGSHVSDGANSAGGRSSGSGKRSPRPSESSRPGPRRPRPRDPRLTATPRSRQKPKAGRPSSGDRAGAAEMMVIKCLDGDGGQVTDMDLLNQQFNTFDSLEPPATPSKAKKKTIRRSQSDVTRLAGQTPTGSAPQTPRSLTKKKGMMRRSQSFADATPDAPLAAKGTMAPVPPVPRKPNMRQAIPRRAKSSTTEYLQQLQQNEGLATSEHGKEELQVQSAHSATNRTGLAAAHTAMMKSASARLLGGLAKSQKTVENALALARIASFSKQKGEALLDSDEEDDGDEFANDDGTSNDAGVMLRDFGSSSGAQQPSGGGGGNSDELGGPSKTQRRPQSSRNLMSGNRDDMGGGMGKTQRRPQSSRNLMTGGGGDMGVPRTPRRPRSSRNLMHAAGNPDDGGVSRTPRRPKSARNLMGGDDMGVTRTPRRPQSSRNLVIGNSDDMGVSKNPRRPQSSRNLFVGGGGGNNDRGDVDVTATPRRRRATLAMQASDAVSTKTPRQGRRTLGRRSKSMDERATSAEFSEDNDSNGDMDDGISIDEADYKVLAAAESGTTGRRTNRERLATHRPMPRRDNSTSGTANKGLKTPMTARSRIRRASLASGNFGKGEIQALPNLLDDDNNNNGNSKQPAVPSTPKLTARSRIRRASLGHTQETDDILLDGPAAPAPPAPPMTEDLSDGGEDAAPAKLDVPTESGHVRGMRSARPGRVGRRGSVGGSSNPMLKQALAHMPQDITHAVRGDLQEEWKRQEQMEDMRKKAQELQNRYKVPVQTAPGGEVFDADFDPEFQPPDHENENQREDDDASGADLELAAEDQDMSDLSSVGPD